ncbi:transposase-like protein [Arthrobacter sp. UYEF20]
MKQLTKTVFETALDEEMSEHLGYERHDACGNHSIRPEPAKPDGRALEARSERIRHHFQRPIPGS